MRKFGMIITFPIAFTIVGFLLYGPLAIASEEPGRPYSAQLPHPEQYQDSALFNIQNQIYQAFVQSISGADLQAMSGMEERLNRLYEAEPQNLVRYWQGYLQYYKAIYWLKNEDEKQGKKAIMEAIDLLESIDGKNSEDYAMLALAESFSIQFQSGIKAPIISARVKKYAEKAVALDPENLRAYYVMASNDFYTPEQYGGMQNAEEHLLKAVSLPEQSAPNPFLPSWGKDDAYVMLMQFYLKEDQNEEAMATYREAATAFPDNYRIMQMASIILSE